MPMIETGVNYNDVPLVLPKIEPGVYDIEITGSEITENKDKNGVNLVVKGKIVSEGPFKNRVLTQYFALTPPNEFSTVNLKRLFASAQVPPRPDGGLNSDDLHGKLIKVSVDSRTYTDQKTNQVRETSDVKKILIPQENWA